MMVQYAKFIKVAQEVPFRQPVPSINYLETSTLWRQEHNGFSHQNPGFINAVMNMKSSQVRIYLPPDSNTLISTMDHCLKSRNYINLIISTKLPTPNWLSMEEAVVHCRVGCSVWKWASTDDGIDPDVVLAGCGNEVTTEVIAAAILLREHCPRLRVRVVNITDMMVFDLDRKHPHALTKDKFNAIFTEDKPVILNFHGYPSAIKQVLFGRPNLERFHILGYVEEGTTTTPFAMLTGNHASRFHVAIKALEVAMPYAKQVAMDAPSMIAYFQHVLKEHKNYIFQYGKDPVGLEQVIVRAQELKKAYDSKECKFE
jgi:xylulose-5-phosphate/fructose-6-phosphate phosphoketolase